MRDAPRLTFRTVALRGALAALALLALPARVGAWRHEIPLGGYAGEAIVDAGGDVLVGGQLGNNFAVVKLTADGTELWRTQLGSVASNFASSLATDAANDVIAAGILYTATLDANLAVVKLSAATGAEVWRSIGGLSGNYSSYFVAVDGDGDVIAAGSLVPTSSGSPDFVARKLDGATGAQLWEHVISGSDPDGFGDAATAVAVDAAGNAIVAGHLENVSYERDLIIVKLDAGTGDEIWRRTFDEGFENIAGAVAVDAADAPIVGCTLDQGLTVLKLDGATGADVWRRELPRDPGDDGVVEGMAMDAAGDIVAAGSLRKGVFSPGPGPPNFEWAVMKVDGDTGAMLWSREIHLKSAEYASDVAVDAMGDVVTVGAFDTNLTGVEFAIVKLTGTTGTERWRQVLDSQTAYGDAAYAVAVVPGDDVVAAGLLGGSFAVVGVSGLDGAVGPIAGDHLLVRDHAGNPGKRRIIVDLTDQSFTTSAGGDGADPTLFGATLTLTNHLTSESATMSLPSAGWIGMGNPAGSAGYRYRDATGADGACRRARVRDGLLRLTCLGSQGPIDFSLDEPNQGVLTLSLQLGNGVAQCVRFGGEVRQDAGTSNPGPGGVFQARSAPPFDGDCP